MQVTSLLLESHSTKGLGDGVDRLAQAHVGGGGLFRERLLVGNVDGDADEMRARLARVLDEFGSGAQPDPLAGGVLDPKLVIDGFRLRGEHHRRDMREIAVAGMQHGVEFVDRKTATLRFAPKYFMHRVGPIRFDPALCPSPKGRSGRSTAPSPAGGEFGR